MTGRLSLGVDSSTSATKVIAFDEAGKVVAEGAQGYPLHTDRPGWVEQDPEDWWRAFVAGCRQVVAAPGVDVRRMAGVGLTHQRFTFFPADRDLRPLRRAILWNDIRCAQEADWASATLGKERIFERTGYPPGQWTLYKLLWLKNHEPEVYARTFKLLLVQDYLIWRLTGNLVTLPGAATMTGALDIADPRRWAKDVIRGLGLRDDVFIEPILPGATVAGTVTRAAAAETGLPEGLPVVTGAGDQPCGILGAGVTRPGQLGINGGTSCTNELVASRLPERKRLDYVVELSPTGDYIVENYIPSGGSAVMNWYRNNFGAAEVEQARRDGVGVWDVIYGEADQAPVGNRGMMAIPYLNGANGPYWDLNARGVIFGVHADHGRPHMVRALLEGCAYESRRQVELMEAGTGTRVEEIRMYGGSARSDLWNQMFADVFAKPLRVPETAETTALGAAISAAVATGVHDGFRQCVDRMVAVRRSYAPVPRNVEVYQDFYDRVYRRFYDGVSGLVREIAAINERSPAPAQA